ncbi:MAG: general stress protein CsbD [Flavobacteriaceae bacterium]|nr:general stress protein CsbD [Flavobacteriaceae bacterium]
MKSSTELRNNWYEIRANLKKKFAKLSDNDLLFVEGRQSEMIEKLQKKLGLTKEDIHKIISDL